MPHQRFQHRKFAGGERQLVAIFVQRTQAHVERKRPEGNNFLVARRRARHFGGWPAAKHRVDARQQFARVEGLGEIVVGADFQADDAVNVLALGGQHDDGRTVIGGPQTAANRQTVFARHHQIEHDQVNRVAQHDSVQRLAVFGQYDLEAFLGQVTTQQVTNAGVVIKDENLVGAGGLSLGHGDLVICNRVILRA